MPRVKNDSSKYKNVKTAVGDKVFDSKLEAQRYVELREQEQSGWITGLRTQVRYTLIPSQMRDDGSREAPCSYIADFVYHDRFGHEVVEDTKGYVTDAYVIKRKLMLEKYGITIKQINLKKEKKK